MPHPNVIGWDDVPAREVDLGPLRFRRRRLGAAAGAARAGLSLWELPPGGRSTPPHVHSDEEERCYVLDGSGLSWQDGRTYAIGPGDVLLHRCGEDAHTLIAGDDGLSVLAFGEGSRTNLTHMPRTAMMWAASHWLPADAAHPFQADADLGDLDVPEPEAERPSTIVAIDDVPPSETDRGPTRLKRRDAGRALGSVTTGLRHQRVAPGARGAPHHCHGAEEELFVVLGGDGEVRLGDERFPLARGTVVARPPGTGEAHSFWAGESGLELLAWGTREPNDIVSYPDSGKVFLRGVGLIGRLEPADAWDGEE
jgi:uncharacterized cupin superfamily protein